MESEETGTLDETVMGVSLGDGDRCLQTMVEECEYRQDDLDQGEVDEDLAESFRRANRRKVLKGVGTVLALFGLFILPWLPVGMAGVEQRMLGVLAAVVSSWLFELFPIQVTALLIAPVCVVYGVSTKEEAFYYYADPLLFLFYGAFFIAAAMTRHGLDTRLALMMTSFRFVRNIPWRVRLITMLCGAVMSMWISNTASAAILIPIMMGTLPTLNRPHSSSVAGSVLAVAYSCSVGGVASLVGTPPNLITVRLLATEGYHINFLSWLVIGAPVALGLVLVIFFFFLWLHPVPSGVEGPSMAEGVQNHPLQPENVSFTAGQSEAGGSASQVPLRVWSRAELVTGCCFAAAVMGWLVPPFLKLCGASSAEAVQSSLPVGVVAMLASAPLFVIPEHASSSTPVLPWKEALKIDWGLIMLFGGGISLGTAMKRSGLALTLGRAFVKATGVSGAWTVTGVFTVFTVFFTEICSNTASANILVPLVIGVCEELGVSPVPACLGVALGASCAFMLPIATGPNAIAYGTSLVPMTTMMRTGALLNVLASGVIFLLLRLIAPAMGWETLSSP